MIKAKHMSRLEYERLTSATSLPHRNTIPFADNGVRNNLSIHMGLKTTSSKNKYKNSIKVGVMTSEEYQALSSYQPISINNSIPEGYIARVVSSRKIEMPTIN